MFHSRIAANPPAPPTIIHHQFCGCTDCSIARYPIGHRARRRAIAAWGLTFSLIAFAFYGFVLVNAAPVAASVGVGQ